jgi:hypothetical protein
MYSDWSDAEEWRMNQPVRISTRPPVDATFMYVRHKIVSRTYKDSATAKTAVRVEGVLEDGRDISLETGNGDLVQALVQAAPSQGDRIRIRCKRNGDPWRVSAEKGAGKQQTITPKHEGIPEWCTAGGCKRYELQGPLGCEGCAGMDPELVPDV